MAIDVIPLRAFRDNYIWCLQNGTAAVVVDPGDAAPVLRHLRDHDLQLVAILVTHHHPDHVGGVEALAAEYSPPVFGPARESIPGRNHALVDGDRVAVPELELAFDVLDVPGHTAGHIAYVGHDMLFCGDTLFSVGCGRLFEGTPAQMAASLARLAALPSKTRVYCTHEYTQSNIRFALAVEPDNTALQARARDVTVALDAGRPSLPSTIGSELAVNPFLRGHVATVAKAAEREAGRPLASPPEVFATLRAWKDRF